MRRWPHLAAVPLFVLAFCVPAAGQVDPADPAAAEASWRGVMRSGVAPGSQGQPARGGVPLRMRLVIRSTRRGRGAGVTLYTKSRCKGSLDLLRRSAGRLVFRDRVISGGGTCSSGDLVVVEPYDTDRLHVWVRRRGSWLEGDHSR